MFPSILPPYLAELAAVEECPQLRSLSLCLSLCLSLAVELGRLGFSGLFNGVDAVGMATGLAWAAVILTAYSGVEYVVKAWPVLTGRDAPSNRN